MKCLVAGWFSFEQMGATAGDLIARDVLCARLRRAGIPYDVALAHPFAGGVDWRTVCPEAYSDVVFVCGPLGNGWPVTAFFERFSGKRISGLNVSMLQPLEEWNPFHLLLERDSNRAIHPDITFSGQHHAIPVAGIILVHPQKEYGKRSMHAVAHERIRELLQQCRVAAVEIDTCLFDNKNGFHTPEEVESMIAKMDLVITTRLHGTVLALKHGIPVLPIDPISGGAKITMQVRTLGWPLLFGEHNLQPADLRRAFDFCLTEEARVLAKQCSRRACGQLDHLLEEFMSVLLQEAPGKRERQQPLNE